MYRREGGWGKCAGRHLFNIHLLSILPAIDLPERDAFFLPVSPTPSRCAAQTCWKSRSFSVSSHTRRMTSC